MVFSFMMSSRFLDAQEMLRSIDHAADLLGVGDDHRLVHPAQAEAAHGRAVTVQLPERASHQRHLDVLGRCGLWHVVQPAISATVLPRLAAMRSGDGMVV